MKLKAIFFLLGCISLFALASCTEEESELPGIENENVMVKLTAVIDSKEFSTDNEIVPMRATRALGEDYYVARILNYTMVIIKKISKEDNNQPTWVIEKKQTIKYSKFITTTEGFGETFEQILRPGEYKFLLLINGEINTDLDIGSAFDENGIPWLTSREKDYSIADIFFAIKDVTITKTGTLNETNNRPVTLTLEPKRYSSLIRFALVGSDFFPDNDISTIEYDVERTISGLNLFGQDVQEDESNTISRKCGIKQKSYSTSGQELFFSYSNSENKQISLLSSATERKIGLTIKSIGESNFPKPYRIDDVITLRNRITTILLEKNESNETINHEIQEKAPDDWASNNTIPWEFIELNNN